MLQNTYQLLVNFFESFKLGVEEPGEKDNLDAVLCIEKGVPLKENEEKVNGLF